MHFIIKQSLRATILQCKSRDVTCYFWLEWEGDLIANSFASCVIDFLENLTEDSEIKQIIIFSDGCSYQNRNACLSNALLRFAVEKNILTTQKYLEKGHALMMVDSVIERKLKKKPIFNPYAYVEYIKQARPSHPYGVHYPEHDFSKNYSDLKLYIYSSRSSCRWPSCHRHSCTKV